MGIRAAESRRDRDVGDRNGGRIRHDHTPYTKPRQNHHHGPAQPNRSLNHQVRGKPPESIGALNKTATAAKRDIEGRANGQNCHQIGARQMQIIRNPALKSQERDPNQDSTSPCNTMEAAIHRGFSFRGVLLSHYFCGDDLERECDRGNKSQKRVDDCGMPEPDGAERPCNRDVVNHVDRRREA